MYQPLEKFIRVETWHTSHPLDEQRFYRALNEIVRLPGFHPSDMADYFRQYLGPKAAAYEKAIDKYEGKAQAVHSFLYEIGETDR